MSFLTWIQWVVVWRKPPGGGDVSVEPSTWQNVNDVIRAVITAYPPIKVLMGTAEVSAQAVNALGFDPDAMGSDDKAVEAAPRIVAKVGVRAGLEAARRSVREDEDGRSYEEMDAFLDRLAPQPAPKARKIL